MVFNKKENLNKQKFFQDETRAHCFEWMNFLFFKYPVAFRDFDVSIGDRVFHIKKENVVPSFMAQGCWATRGIKKIIKK